MLYQLVGMFDTVDWDGRVLVVDDDSPDGTGQTVSALAEGEPRIELLSGPKRGLGQAYERGFEYVLDNMDVDVIVQMDADFSHAPSDVPRLVAGTEDADLVIGSRYVSGGSSDPSWGTLRKIVSRLGNLLARYVAGIKGVRDCTAGFKAIRVPALRRSFPLRLRAQGYVFQVAFLHALLLNDAKVVEYPIRFVDRRAGETKLDRADVLEFLYHVWWLRLLSKKTFVKFALTGMSGVVVNLGVFTLLLNTTLHTYLSSIIAIEVSIIWNFFLNNYWTFRDRIIRARKTVRGLKFNLVSFFTLGVSFSTFVFARWLWPEQPELLAQALGILPAALANYFANSYWTFRADHV